MSLIMNWLDMGIPTTVDRVLRAARDLGYARFYESNVMPQDEKTKLMELLKKQGKMLRNFEAKQCFHNSQMLIVNTQNDPVFSQKLKYCEGYWMSPSIPIAIPHAWLVYDDKYVVDVTMTTRGMREPRLANLSDRAICEFPNDWEYYGIIIDRDEILNYLMKFGETISVLDDYRITRKRLEALEKELADRK